MYIRQEWWDSGTNRATPCTAESSVSHHGWDRQGHRGTPSPRDAGSAGAIRRDERVQGRWGGTLTLDSLAKAQQTRMRAYSRRSRGCLIQKFTSEYTHVVCLTPILPGPIPTAWPTPLIRPAAPLR